MTNWIRINHKENKSEEYQRWFAQLQKVSEQNGETVLASGAWFWDFKNGLTPEQAFSGELRYIP